MANKFTDPKRTGKEWNEGPPVNPWCLLAISISLGVFGGGIYIPELTEPGLYAVMASFVVAKIVYSHDKKLWQEARAELAEESARKLREEFYEWDRKYLGQEAADLIRAASEKRRLEGKND